jgi:hypothetical protein
MCKDKDKMPSKQTDAPQFKLFKYEGERGGIIDLQADRHPHSVLFIHRRVRWRVWGRKRWEMRTTCPLTRQASL